LGWRVETFGVAPVFFDVIHAPLGVAAGVLLFVPVGPGPTLTGPAAGVRVDPELEALLMNVVRERLDASRKAHRIGDDPAPGVTGDLPAIVDDDVLVTRVAHAARGQGIRGLANQRRAHVTAEVVPAVPAHGRGAGEPIREDSEE